MIKKVFKHLLTIFIVGLGIINFSSAEYLELNGSLNINSIDVELLPGTNFLSNSQYKVLQTSASYWRHTLFWNNGMLYIITSESYRADINTNIISQGYMKGYCQKDIDPSTASSDTSTCDPSRGNNPSGIYMSEFYNSSQINKNADGLYIEDRGQQIRYCFDYYDIGKRNCFRYDVIESQGYFLTGTLNLTSNYSVGTDGFITDTLPYLENSVFGSSSSGGGDGTGSDSELGDVIVNNSGSLVSSCNKQKALNWYENRGYTKNLCYGGFDNYGTGNLYLPVYGTGKDVEDIWLNTANIYQGGITGDTMGYDEWFGYWRNLFNLYRTGPYNINPFENTPNVLYGYFSSVYNYGNSFNNFSILDYCDLKLYSSDLSVGYYGVNINNVCSVLDIISDQISSGIGSGGNIGGSGDIGSGDVGSGIDVEIGFNTNDILNLSGLSLGSGGSGGNFVDNKVYTDGTDFIKDFFAVLQNNFGSFADYGNGILPFYITLALVGLILFRFLSH